MALLPETSSDRLGHLLAQLAEELRPLITEWVERATARPAPPAPQSDADRWLTPSEAAARVGVHRRTIYRALSAGTLVGGQLEAGSGACRWRIRTSEIDRWAGVRTERFAAPASRPSTQSLARRSSSSANSYRARLKENNT